MECEKFNKYNRILEKLEPIKIISPSDYFSVYNKVIDLYLFSHFQTDDSKYINNDSKYLTINPPIINNYTNYTNYKKCNCDYYNKKYSCIKLFDLPKCKHIETIKENFPMIKILLEKGYGKMRLPIHLHVLSHNMEIMECIEFITEFSNFHTKITKIEIVSLLSCIIFIVSNFTKIIRSRDDILNSTLDMIDHFFDVYKSMPYIVDEIFQEFFSNSREECLDIIKSWKFNICKWNKKLD